MIRLKVKEIAQRKNLSQSRLGRLADIDQGTMRRIFNDPAPNITLETLNRLARALRMHPADLIEYEPDPLREEGFISE
jgi:DNA-binding Xre family transcriptional regulator